MLQIAALIVLIRDFAEQRVRAIGLFAGTRQADDPPLPADAAAVLRVTGLNPNGTSQMLSQTELATRHKYRGKGGF